MSTVNPARAPSGPPPLPHQPPPTCRILPGRYIVAVEVAPTGLPLAPWLEMSVGRVPRSVSWPSPSLPPGSSSYICVPVMLNRLPLPGATNARGCHQRFSSAPAWSAPPSPYATELVAPSSVLHPEPSSGVKISGVCTPGPPGPPRRLPPWTTMSPLGIVVPVGYHRGKFMGASFWSPLLVV